jgi:hypothetical protein
MKVYQQISSLLNAIANCQKSGNSEWSVKHSCELDTIERNLPRGSGIDCGTKISRDSTSRKIVLVADFHHMDDNGYYDGWTNHKIIVTPSFDGIDIRVTGQNRNDIKDYLADVYHYALNESMDKLQTV